MTGSVNAVFIGTSNVVPGTWPERLCTLEGWTCRNYAVSGMGYTYGASQGDDFAGQAARAVADPAFTNASVSYVFVCDAGNDARGNRSVNTPAASLLRNLQVSFPNARIIVLPVLFSTGPPDEAGSVRYYVTQVSQELRLIAMLLGVEYIDGSWTWHQDDPSLIKSGPNEVHYSPAGNDRVVSWVRHWLRGGDTWANTKWELVPVNTARGYKAPTGAGIVPLSARRVGDFVHVKGGFSGTTGIQQGLVATLRLGLRPAHEHIVYVNQAGSVDPRMCVIKKNGEIIMFPAGSGNEDVQIHTTFSAF